MTTADATSADMTPPRRQERRRATAQIRATPLGRTLWGVSARSSPGDEVTAFVTRALARADLDDKRVCLVVPDGTRTCPLPLLMRAAHSALEGRAKEVTVLIALGTHQGMSEDHLARHLGYSAGAAEETYPGWTISITSPGCRRRSRRWARLARTG